MQKAYGIATLSLAIPTDVRKSIIVRRRCLLLGVVGSTAPDSRILEQVMALGYLTSVKGWLDQLLDGNVGMLNALR
jgi:hypothetical protein